MTTVLRRHASRLVALAVIVILYAVAQLPALSAQERSEIAARFRFTERELPLLNGYDSQNLRQVHPSLDRISAWISSVGAAIAFHDLDADGLPNDLCWVDPRVDQVIVLPAPTSGERFTPFALDPRAVGYDPRTMAPMGCVPGDLNEDSYADLLVYYWGRTPVAFLHRGHGIPSADAYTPVDIVPTGERWFTNAATFADFDGDGHLDLFVGNYFQDGARILDAESGGVEEMQHSMSRAFNAGKNRLLLWAGAGAAPSPSVTYAEASDAFSQDLARGWTLAAGAADLDGDLLPELYVANDFGPDRLFHNRSRPGAVRFALLEGRETPRVPSSKVLGRDSFKGMGVDFSDVNGDGMLDIYVSNIAAEYALEESHFLFVSEGDAEVMASGRAPYVDRSEELGLSRSSWSWESRFGDFDNDGSPEAIQATGFVAGKVNRWPELQELAMGNDELLSDPRAWPRFQPGDDLSGDPHNPFFVRARDGRYYDVAAEVGLGRPSITRGIATADFDGDGDLDFAVANQWEASYLYVNEARSPGAGLGLHLLLPLDHGAAFRVRPGPPGGDTPGRPAVGAAVSVHVPGGRTLTGQVDGGNGHSGVRSPGLHFGLDGLSTETELLVEVSWRDAGGDIQRSQVTVRPGVHTLVLGTDEEAGT